MRCCEWWHNFVRRWVVRSTSGNAGRSAVRSGGGPYPSSTGAGQGDNKAEETVTREDSKVRRIAGAAVLAAIILLPACGSGSTGSAAPVDQSKTVSKSDLPGWPLTVDSGVLRCVGSAGMVKVTIVVDGKTYGVNGTAMGDKKNLDIRSIWADAKTAGVKKNIGPLVHEGLQLCK